MSLKKIIKGLLIQYKNFDKHHKKDDYKVHIQLLESILNKHKRNKQKQQEHRKTEKKKQAASDELTIRVQGLHEIIDNLDEAIRDQEADKYFENKDYIISLFNQSNETDKLEDIVFYNK